MKNKKKLKVFISSVLVFVFIFSSLSFINTNLIFAEEQSKTENAVVYMINTPTALINDALAYADPLKKGAEPILMDGNTMIPVEFVENGSFAGEIKWNKDGDEVSFKVNEETVKIKEGSKIYTVGNKTFEMPVPAQMVGDRLYIPIRLVANICEKELFYNEGLVILSDTPNIYDPMKDLAQLNNLEEELNQLLTIGTEENFIKIAGDPSEQMIYEESIDYAPQAAASAGTTSEDASSVIPQKSVLIDEATGNTDMSTTNTQVEGVDEADIIKTDGEYIYYLLRNEPTLKIVKATPPDSMEVVYTENYNEKPDNFNQEESKVVDDKEMVSDMPYYGYDTSYYPMEMFLDGDYLTVILTGNEVDIREGVECYIPSTKAIVYDLKDKNNITVAKELLLDGNYITSRKIDNIVYIITDIYLTNMTVTLDEQKKNKEYKYLTPTYYDSSVGNAVEMPYATTCYLPAVYTEAYTSIASFDMNAPDTTANVETFYGASAQNVYCSADNLYIAAVNPNYYYSDEGNENTDIYKFSLNNGDVSFENQGEVNGHILNQFSMDEYNGNFRIATTSNYNKNSWSNNLYVLNEEMEVIGSIEDIAPGEKIYSTRFMGDRAYMVTFEKVDPLFVIDLQNPENPKILGKLKIPGYSDYLHPYDENHVIGFGKDTIVIDDQAYYQGIKMTMFDVTDVFNPVEMYTEVIGDRGTESELLYNHKALLFDKEKDLLAFPITVYELDESQEETEKKQMEQSFPEEGTFAFQGAYVYDIDLEHGFTKKGEITHLSEEDMLKAGNYEGDFTKYINRIIYINDVLYTASDAFIKATDMNSVEDLGQVDLK